MGKVILIAGLPGAGKTTYGKRLANEIGARFFDDFKAKAFSNSPRFQHSRHYKELIQLLRKGKNCIATDIDF